MAYSPLKYVQNQGYQSTLISVARGNRGEDRMEMPAIGRTD
jgi:hypothetical protein